MNQSVANNEGAGHMEQREQLSALADGHLQGDELAQALAFAAGDEGHATWQLYHLVGDVLRSPDLAQPAHPTFMTRLKAELAKEPLPVRVEAPAQVAVVATPHREAANAAVFRWKMVAGVASLAAVAVIGWTSLSALQSGPHATGGAQLAQSADRPVVAAPVVAVVDAEGQQVMIRDPRLDELLAAHKQFGSTSTLQMPAGFLRNATFDSPSR